MSKWEEYDVEIEVTNRHHIRVKAQSQQHARQVAWRVYHGDKFAHHYEVHEDPEPRVRKAYLVKEKNG